MSFLLEQSRKHPRPMEVLPGDRLRFTGSSIKAASRFEFLVRFIRETAPRWRHFRSVNDLAALECEIELRFATDLIKTRLEAWKPTEEPS